MQTVLLGQWYAIAVVGGQEKKIRQRILDSLEKRNIEVTNLQIVCPEEEVIIDSPGKDREVKKRLTLSGYLLAHGRKFSPEALNLISEVKGVMAFLGGNETPTALSPKEVEQILGTQTTSPRREAAKALFEKDDVVTIIEGPMQQFTGVVQEVNDSKQTLQLEVEIFGRKTLTEASFRQVKKGA